MTPTSQRPVVLSYTETKVGLLCGNPYDPCVANMMVNGSQMTVCWHVDNLKISHRDEEVVSAFAIKTSETYRPKTTISRGKVHDYLGMQLDFGTCPGSMIKILDEWPEVLGGTKVYPATDNLFKVREDEDRVLLCEEMARQFHRTTAQLLFLCKRE